VEAGRLRARVLAVASALAGLAGGIYPLAVGYVSPQSAFGLETALAPVVAVMAGGVGTRWGPLLGTVFVVGLQEYLWTRGWQASLGVMGLALVLVGWVFPRGLAGLGAGLGSDFGLFTGRLARCLRRMD
jgi:ABC-type branched-subunit amino acid transport system permease subunit